MATGSVVGGVGGRLRARTLYKSILRAHERYLPSVAMRQLGDAYVKSEFRLHKSAKPEQATLFFVEWEKYLQHIERTGREKQSIQLGLVDPPSKQRDQRQLLGMATGLISSASASSSSLPLSPTTMMTQHGRSTTTDNDVGGGGTVVYFGKDISNDIVFNEEQVSKLEQLRDEATKAASAASTTSGDSGNGGSGGGY